MSRWQRKVQRRRRVAGVVVCVFAGVVVVGAARTAFPGDGPDPREGSRALPGGTPPVEVGEPPLSYEITYRVTTYGGEDEVVTTVRHSVGRPFDAEVAAFSGDELLNRRVSAFGLLGFTGGTPGAPLEALEVPPAPAASDLRFEPVVAELTDARREVREVAGRRCSVFRFGDEVATGVVVPYEPGAQEWADVCVDADGLLLEEVWVRQGELARRRLATSVRVGEPVAVEVPAPTLDTIEEGGGSLRAIDPSTDPGGPMFELPSDPTGFERHGRYLVVHPRAQDGGATAEPDQGRTAGLVDVWVDGADFVLIEQGATEGGSPPFGTAPTARPVSLGSLGDGEAFLDLRGNEARAVLEGGAFVRVVATLPLDEVVAIARALVAVEGEGDLRVLDGG